MRRSIYILLIFLAGACDRNELPVAPTTAPKASDKLLSMDVRSITQLEPGRATNVAVTRSGSIYWVQETAEENDLVFEMDESGVPRSTPIGSTGITTMLGERGTGNVQSLAAMGDSVWFYFSGGSGAKSMCVIGRYQPGASDVQIFVGSEQLSAASDMGFALDVARGTLLTTEGGSLWLWLRHSDEGLLLRIDPSAEPGSPKAISRPFKHLLGASEPIDLRSNDLRLAGGAGDSLLMIDPGTSTLWRVASDGSAEALWDLGGLPRRTARPVWSKDRILLFAARSESMVDSKQQAPPIEPMPAEYPTFVTLRQGERAVVVTPNAIVTRGDVDSNLLDLSELVPESKPNSWIAYDRRSGHLLRFSRIHVPGLE